MHLRSLPSHDCWHVAISKSGIGKTSHQSDANTTCKSCHFNHELWTVGYTLRPALNVLAKSPKLTDIRVDFHGKSAYSHRHTLLSAYGGSNGQLFWIREGRRRGHGGETAMSRRDLLTEDERAVLYCSPFPRRSVASLLLRLSTPLAVRSDPDCAYLPSRIRTSCPFEPP